MEVSGSGCVSGPLATAPGGGLGSGAACTTSSARASTGAEMSARAMSSWITREALVGRRRVGWAIAIVAVGVLKERRDVVDACRVEGRVVAKARAQKKGVGERKGALRPEI